MMKAFYYNNLLYIRCVPAKTLFHSTMVHEVVNRGDVFAIEVASQKLTIIPGTADVEHVELAVSKVEPAEPRKPATRKPPAGIAASLNETLAILRAGGAL